MKKALSILTCLSLILSLVFSLAACGNKNETDGKTENSFNTDKVTLSSAYNEAQNLGFEGTLDEFIALISGKDGEDGVDGAPGKDGVSPTIGENGNWWIGNVDTGVCALPQNGENGKTPLLRINPHTHEWEASYNGGENWLGLGYTVNETNSAGFDGLKISILGDSISTYVNASSGSASKITNSTIYGGAVYYNEGTLGVYQGDTWWQQTADILGGSILVNNSWSGSCVWSTRSGTVGAYVDRCVQLHDNTGLNAGEEPDIIFVYLGTNDCTVGSSYPLGDYESIDFGKLIQKNADGYVYAEPKTASEAYAIMIHKMIQRYTDAEVYCIIPCQRRDGNTSSIEARLKFYDAISRIANRFGAYSVDLYNDSGITTESDSFSTFIPDGSLHPGCEGMDAITNTVLSSLYQNSKYASKYKKVYSVSYETDAVILEGRRYAALEDEQFSCTIKKKNGYQLNISVFMNGEDITNSASEDNKIFISHVNGNITISAAYEKFQRAPQSYRFETVDDQLISVTTDSNVENTVTQISGSITDGFYNQGHFSLDTEIALLHSRNWAVEWKVKGTPSMLLLSGASTSSGNTNGDCYIFVRAIGDIPIITIGEYAGSRFDNYACQYDNNYIDDFHIYRLENKIDDHGNNMVYLYIDGVEIGVLNMFYNGATNQNSTSNWINGKDFYFSYIGTVGTDHRHPISDCYLEYLQVWESLE